MKVGTFEIPDYRLTETLIDATKKIYDTYKSETAPDNNVVATLLGHKSASGAYLSKIASLRSYGLVEKRGIKVTELGKRIVYPTGEEDKNDAFNLAIFNIPLWKELYKNFGTILPKENFWANLNKITGLETPDSKKLEDPVRNAYIEDLKNLKTVEKPIQPPEKPNGETRTKGILDRTPRMESQIVVSTQTIGYIGYPEYSQAPIEIKDAVSYEIAQKLLEAIGTKLGITATNQKKVVSKSSKLDVEKTGESDVENPT